MYIRITCVGSTSTERYEFKLRAQNLNGGEYSRLPACRACARVVDSGRRESSNTLCISCDPGTEIKFGDCARNIGACVYGCIPVRAYEN